MKVLHVQIKAQRKNKYNKNNLTVSFLSFFSLKCLHLSQNTILVLLFNSTPKSNYSFSSKIIKPVTKHKRPVTLWLPFGALFYMSISAFRTHGTSRTRRNCTGFRRPPPLSPEPLKPPACSNDASTTLLRSPRHRRHPAAARAPIYDGACTTLPGPPEFPQARKRNWTGATGSGPAASPQTAAEGGTAPERPAPTAPASPKHATGSADRPPRETRTPTTPALGPPRTCPWSAAGPSPSARTWRPGGGAGPAEGLEPDKSGPGTD